jgi:hypothetical protein
VTPFRAYFFPSGYSLSSEESSHLDTPGGPVQYPVLSRPRMEELMGLLRTARQKGLVSFPVERVVGSVDRVARRLLDPADELRQHALAGLGPHAGFSQPMAVTVLDGMARDWTAPRLNRLLSSEFPDPLALDGFRPGPVGGLVRAMGLPFTFHLGAGSVPGVAVTSLIRALLVKSAAFLKPGLGDVTLPIIFAEGLEEEDPELARSLAVAYWPSDLDVQTELLLGGADLVVVYGGEDAVRWVQGRLPPRTPLKVYRHRLGVGLVGRGALGQGGESEGEAGEGVVGEEVGAGGHRTATDAAWAVALFDQRGCVSPHVLFVERGGAVDPEGWAKLLAGALGELERELPSGQVSPEEGAALQQLRGTAEVEEEAGHGTVYHGGRKAPWTVLVQTEGELTPSCLNRVVRVVPVNDLAEVPSRLQAWVPFLQTVGVAGLADRGSRLREALARVGVSRIVGFSGVPWPPPWWHHDGGGPLRGLVRWTDVEEGG